MEMRATLFLIINVTPEPFGIIGQNDHLAKTKIGAGAAAKRGRRRGRRGPACKAWLER